jgi:hypothetical protein
METLPKVNQVATIAESSFIVALNAKVKKANILFADKLTDKLWNGLEIEQYIRYLQVQYHLTKGVQTTFLTMASHADTRSYKELRAFLINFGYEEEMHYKLAEKDLAELDSPTGEIPFVVELWWAYQRAILPTKPLERLGATAILENIGNFAAPVIKELMAEADFINKKNSSFTLVHMHEELPHGDQILDALANENFSELHQSQILEGASKATWLYANTIFDWIITGKLI